MAPNPNPPDDDYVMKVCQPGKGALTCRYLTMAAGGWSCEKLVPALKSHFDARVARGDMNAQGDNCEGRGSR